MKLYYHPISSYSQKVVTAFHEKGVAFTPEIVDIMDPAARAEYKKINAFSKVPTLVLDDGWRIPESTIIIEYVDAHFPTTGTRLIPEDKDLARQTRFWDRFGDLYLSELVAKIFFDSRRPEGQRDPYGVKQAQARLEVAVGLLDERLAKASPWVMGQEFSMGDCSMAPALGYMRMVQPFDAHKNVAAYFQRLVERRSFKRVLDEAAPFIAAAMARK
jgi:glutathione S-transferase